MSESALHLIRQRIPKSLSYLNQSLASFVSNPISCRISKSEKSHAPPPALAMRTPAFTLVSSARFRFNASVHTFSVTSFCKAGERLFFCPTQRGGAWQICLQIHMCGLPMYESGVALRLSRAIRLSPLFRLSHIIRISHSIRATPHHTYLKNPMWWLAHIPIPPPTCVPITTCGGNPKAPAHLPSCAYNPMCCQHPHHVKTVYPSCEQASPSRGNAGICTPAKMKSDQTHTSQP